MSAQTDRPRYAAPLHRDITTHRIARVRQVSASCCCRPTTG